MSLGDKNFHKTIIRKSLRYKIYVKRIVIATNNKHKLTELRRMLGAGWEVLGLEDIGCQADIPEDSDTFEGNALQKARWVMDRYGAELVAADDSGLEVDALDGAPGVLSARFSGKPHDDAANNALLLERLAHVPDEARTARFRTAVCLLRRGDSKPLFFDGSVEGHISRRPEGDGGFGYDPLFIPRGWDCSFAQASPEMKDSVSHRGRAVRKLIDFLAKN